MTKLPIKKRRAEMVRHILAAKQIAEEGDEQVLAYMLEMALREVVGSGDAEKIIERIFNEAIQ